MKICVIGPGAMGCLFAASVSQAGHPAILLDYRPERADVIRERGVIIEEPDGRRIRVQVPITCDPSIIGNVDAVFIWVKSYSTELAARSTARFATSSSLVVTMQNGIGNVEILADILRGFPIVAGITTHGATMLEHGIVRHAGIGDTYMGPVSGEKENVERLVKVLCASHIETKFVDNIRDILWSKLVINAGINAITAITRLKNGNIINRPETEALLESAVTEGIEVGKKEGIKFIYRDPVAQAKQVCARTASNASSMLQDIMRHKKTEIDSINGAIVAKGRMNGIPTPVNFVLANLVKTIQNNYEAYAR